MDISGRALPESAEQPGPGALKRLAARMGRFSGFALISGLGWCLDFSVMATLTHGGMAVFWANSIGAFCGVTFVFFVAGRRIFRPTARWSLAQQLGLYWAWQVIAITAASALTALASWLLLALAGGFVQSAGLGADLTVTLSAVSAKMLVTPLTLVANFLFMRFLLETGTPD